MKLAPVLRALQNKSGVSQTVIHTGQHYDVNMSDVFFQELGIGAPDVNLAVGSGTHAQQTSEVMIRLEPFVHEGKPDIVLVYGDVNSTVATALLCSKLGIPVGHVEAGLRSFDRTMPEEINRVVTDQLADLLFTPSSDGDANLAREGIHESKIFCVGNVMIDSLIRLLPSALGVRQPDVPDRYALVTLHRPANVDDDRVLCNLIRSLCEMNEEIAVLFPVHPRTRQRIVESGLNLNKIQILDPQPYIAFLGLQARAAVVVTDSGGIQEETTYLGVPCLTMRDNTERPITVSMGTNVLVGRDPGRLRSEFSKALGGKSKRGVIPPLWDGRSSERIAEVLLRHLAV